MISKKQNEEEKKTNKDLLILLLLLLISFLVISPTLNYPLQGDTVYYADIIDHFFDHEYADPNYSNKILPLFTLVSLIFKPFASSVMAIRLSSMLWSSLTIITIYMLSRKLQLSKQLSIIISLLVLFNPWYLYYTATLPLTESLSVFLVTLAYLLFYNDKIYFSSIIFSLAIMTRYTNALFVLPTLLWYGFILLKSLFNSLFSSEKKEIFNSSNKKLIGKIIMISIILILPVLLWTGYNAFNDAALNKTDYANHFIYNPNKGFALIPVYFGVLLEYIFKALPIMFLLLLPLLIINYIIILLDYRKRLDYNEYDHKEYDNITKKEKIFWWIVLLGFIFHLLFYSFWVAIMKDVLFPHVWEKIRYLVLFIPVFTLMAFRLEIKIPAFNRIHLHTLNHLFNRKIMGILLLLLLFIPAASYLNYGFVKDKFDAFYPTSSVYAQRSWHQTQGIALFNRYLEENNIINATVLGVLSSDSENEHKNYYMQEYLNSGKTTIEYVGLKTMPKLTRKDIKTTFEQDKQFLNNKRAFIFSEFNDEETINRLQKHTAIKDIKLKELLRTNYQPYVFLFEIEQLVIN